MQIAQQIFKIPVAENALIYFKDGSPAYITRRFDVNSDGSKLLQEDFAQISGKTRKANGEHYKYEGSYEAIGLLIKEKVAASKPVLEVFFKVVLYNYLFSNGDAHLKNFSLVSEGTGDYTLSKSYDLLCTVLHTPHESDTALELFEGDLLSSFYLQYGYFGRPDFEELAQRLELKPRRAAASINMLLSSKAEVLAMVAQSFLSEVAKGLYMRSYEDKLGRFD